MHQGVSNEMTVFTKQICTNNLLKEYLCLGFVLGDVHWKYFHFYKTRTSDFVPQRMYSDLLKESQNIKAGS